MTEEPKWYREIVNKYRPSGLGIVAISENDVDFLDSLGNSLPHELVDKIKRDVSALEFLDKHKIAPRRWRSWLSKNMKNY